MAAEGDEMAAEGDEMAAEGDEMAAAAAAAAAGTAASRWHPGTATASRWERSALTNPQDQA